jgi:cell pole-organizing protein PopZ
MEDILASIRRILSEDEPSSLPNEATASAHDAGPHEASHHDADHHDDGHDDVLELDPSMIVEDPYDTVPMSADRQPPTASAAQPAISARVPASTHEAPPQAPTTYDPSEHRLPIEEPSIHQVPVAEASVPLASQPAPPADPVTPVQRETGPVPVPQISIDPHVHTLGQSSMEQPLSSTPYAPAPSSAAADEGLVAPSAAAGVASSVGELLRAVAAKREPVPVYRNGPTIEDLVREEMRPILKAWLDTNLPPLVERLVRIEIERVVSRAF